MTPTPDLLRRLEQALLSAFPTPSSLARVLRYGLDVRLAEIAPAASFREQVFTLVVWAEAEHRLEELAGSG